jgi:prophage regulatory protein
MLVADRIVRMKTVLAPTGLSLSTIYRKIAEGTFPAQIRISLNGAGWRETDIDRWIGNPRGGGGRKNRPDAASEVLLNLRATFCQVICLN